MNALGGTPAGQPAQFANWSEANQQWLIDAIARLRARLQGQATVGGSEATVEAGPEPAFTPALIHCAQVFGLSPFEREVLLLVAGLELDSGLRAAVAALNDGVSPRANYAFAFGMLTQPHWGALSPDAPLRYWRLVEPEAGMPLTQAALRIDERILHFISGVAASDVHLHGVARHLQTAVAEDAIETETAKCIAQSASTHHERGCIAVLYGNANDSCTRRDVALAAVAALRQP
ncbi:MAG TPA: hypothetical protein VNH44_09680, partial [Micropepsaceae bacterium]|nr:hypothetical protein [Micropepsaceae bacterium]